MGDNFEGNPYVFGLDRDAPPPLDRPNDLAIPQTAAHKTSQSDPVDRQEAARTDPTGASRPLYLPLSTALIVGLLSLIAFAMAGFSPYAVSIVCIIIALAFAPLAMMWSLSPSGIEHASPSINDVDAGLIAEAKAHALGMEQSIPAIGNRQIGQRASKIVAMTKDILDLLDKDPSRARRLRRFLSYYVPRTAGIISSYAAIAMPDRIAQSRIDEVEQVFSKIEKAFAFYVDGLLDNELADLAIDLRLVQASIDEDIGR